MKVLRRQLDRVRPHFETGGRLEKLFPLYDVVDNFFYSHPVPTTGATHARDGVDVQRIMVIVWLATFPAMFWGCWNLGNQSLTAMAEAGLTSPGGWRAPLISLLSSHNPDSLWDCLWFGFCYFVPIYVVTFAAGIFWEALFAITRKHEINEGFFVTSVLFALSCPPDVPLWQVALGISFGVVIAKEIFGGTGKNFVNPALAGRAFLYLSYPAAWTGDTVWMAADGVTGATPLGLLAEGGMEAVYAQFSFVDVAIGTVPGSIGETSLIAIGLGAAVLLLTRVASWRIMAGVAVGVAVFAGLFNLFGDSPQASMPVHWHFVCGGLLFGMVFMATEPVSAAATQAGRWIYGLLIGFMVVLIRIMNPGFPEGMMLAILFANLCAPLIDHLVIQARMRRRQRMIESVIAK